MQSHGIALRRWISWHRRELTLATALILAAALFVLVAPGLLAVAALEWKHGRKRSRLLGLALAGLLARAVVWLWQELRGVPHGRWHPCLRCRAPIEEPSRAWYCSPACRRYARLERDALSPDPWVAERASVKLNNLARLSALDPELTEIPF
jgi:hypothetical protein